MHTCNPSTQEAAQEDYSKVEAWERDIVSSRATWDVE